MRLALLGGVSLAILATTPALAQHPISNAAIVARLNALEAKVDALQARNNDLEHQLADQKAAAAAAPPFAPAPTALASSAPVPGGASGSTNALPSASSGGADAAKSAPKPPQAVTWTIVPQFNSPDGNFTFKPRGILDVDYAGFDERKGGYDYNNGTQIRRGRFGFDGTLYKQLAFRIEAEYVGGTVSLLDAYVAYTGKKNLAITLGQLKVPADSRRTARIRSTNSSSAAWPTPPSVRSAASVVSA